MTPKSLLRLPQATSRIEHLAESRFFPVLSEPRIDEEKVTRLVLCTGKIFYDLKGHATRENNEGVAISRVELLYPFPQAQIEEEIARYPNLREVVWVQEEPRNMGARAHMSPRMLQMLPDHARVRLHRPARARLAGRGLPGRPHAGADADHPHGAGSLDPGVGQPGQGAGRALAVAARSLSKRNPRRSRVSQRGDVTTPQGRHLPMSGRTLRYILVGALALAIGIPSVAVGFGEGRSLLLGKRNPSPSASRALTKETEIIASTGTYGTRQSNKRDGDGGGAIYGCRSATGKEPCIRANNLKGGRAFEFVTDRQGGRPDRGRRPDRRTVHHERDGRRHRLQRRQGRRQGREPSSRQPATRCSPRSTRTARWPPAAAGRPVLADRRRRATYTVTFTAT